MKIPLNSDCLFDPFDLIGTRTLVREKKQILLRKNEKLLSSIRTEFKDYERKELNLND